MLTQQLAQPLTTDAHRPVRVLARYAASLRTLQCVNGRPSAPGRVVAVATMNSMSPSLIRRDTPPAR